MQPAVLLGLLGAAALAAVSSAPVDSRNHNEDMVTRCIIEVLSNALSKSSVPTITPECRQVLKKSGKEVKDEEKSEHENKKFEVRLLRDPADASSREVRAPGEDTRGQTRAGTEKWTERAEEPQERLHPSNRQVSKEAKTLHSERIEGEKREEKEGENYPKGGHKEYAGEEPGETENAFPSERSQAAARNEESVARADTPRGWLSGETHSREQSSREKGEESASEENPPPGLSDRARSQEGSEESEEDAASEAATRARPGQPHGTTRPDRASPEGHPPGEGRGRAPGEPRGAGAGTRGSGEERGRPPARHRASEEAPGGLGGQVGGGGRGQDRAPQHSEEDEGGRPGSAPEDTEDTPGAGSEDERRRQGAQGRQPGGGGERGGARGEQRLSGGGGGLHGARQSRADRARGRPQSQRRGPDGNHRSYGEEEARGKWPRRREDPLDPEDGGEEVGLPDQRYAAYLAAEKRKRLGVLFDPYFDPLRWKNGDVEKKDGMDGGFLEGDDENGLTLAEKNFFPEYNYDWWEKRPFSEDADWGYEKRSFARAPPLDLKRQYDGVAELDQLLHYRKKSAEFPDFYDSEEQMGPRQEVESIKDRADQRVLTEEEEKELENLAAMDLELQKIAEKFGQSG